MLISCPECNKQISDKAISCPNCGYPLKENINTKRSRRKPKRMRLPNGFGQISEIKDRNLRKPFRAMVTVGKTDEGKPICKLLQPEAYFETYNDAYQALMKYNENPFTYSNNMTVEELYEKWTERYFKTTSESSRKRTIYAWRYCDSVKKLKACELRSRHIKYCMEEGTYTKNGEVRHPTPQMKNIIKVIFNNMLDYAVEYEIADRNYARSFNMPKEDKKEMEENCEHHIAYTDDEMKKLWANINTHPLIDVVLIQCYTGWRPKELENMKLSDIDLEAGTMKGGVKTKAGKSRIVPIHSRILDLVKKRCEDSISKGSEYFITASDARSNNKTCPFYYNRFSRGLKEIVVQLGLNINHKPHDGRAHFITQAKKYQMDEYALKRIVGHEIKDITESVYTTRDIYWLKQEMEKIK